MTLDFTQPMTERTNSVVRAVKLKRTQGRRKAHQFLIEGENAVEAALLAGAVTDLFVTEEAVSRFDWLVLQAERTTGCWVHAIDRGAAEALADTVTTTGIFGVCTDVVSDSVSTVVDSAPKLVVVPVETNEPGNAGTMIRLADALGADAVVFAGQSVDPQGGKAVRSSAGSLFHLPVVRDHDVEDVIASLKRAGLVVLATAATGEMELGSAAVTDILRRPVAWLFGNEAHGLAPHIMDLADHRIAIPITGRAESLNVAAAAAVCLWESAKPHS